MSHAEGADPLDGVLHATNQRLDRLTHPLGPGGDWPLDVFPPKVATYYANSASSARVPHAMVGADLSSPAPPSAASSPSTSATAGSNRPPSGSRSEGPCR